MADSPSRSHPGIVGIYGLPGSGKTTLLNQLRQDLDPEHFSFYEGSQAIASVVPGGLDDFHDLPELEKMEWRQVAIDAIKTESEASGKTAIVTGHLMFWSEGLACGRLVCTERDFESYSHIVYLDASAESIADRRRKDVDRLRPNSSIDHLHRWKMAEMTHLRPRCLEHGIIFFAVNERTRPTIHVSSLVRSFRFHTEAYNQDQAEKRLDKLFPDRQQLETALVLDADRTLTPQDASTLFWKRIEKSRRPIGEHPLKALFSGPLGYSLAAFRQAVLFIEEIVDLVEYDLVCQDVASAVVLYPEFLSFLQKVKDHHHVKAVIVTCGLQRVWEFVLQRERLSDSVAVIGAGRLACGFVVTPAVKAALVSRLQNSGDTVVWAFGDSPLDLEMLKRADEAIVVVGHEDIRSKSMDDLLSKAIHEQGLTARQVVLGTGALPRLTQTELPRVRLVDDVLLRPILLRRRQKMSCTFVHATERSATKLLMTPMRDAGKAGPELREAHRRVGWYLANEFVVDMVGVDRYLVPHVQGFPTHGHRLKSEQKTLIMALMRGGEPMAFGVNDAFPLAMFYHAAEPEDIKPKHLDGQSTVLLVDSVINSGNTIVRFVDHIRSLRPKIRIIVIAGVVQEQCLSSGRMKDLCEDEFSLVALRLSSNKFGGIGGTDTGNRLFNTTHLPLYSGGSRCLAGLMETKTLCRASDRGGSLGNPLNTKVISQRPIVRGAFHHLRSALESRRMPRPAIRARAASSGSDTHGDSLGVQDAGVPG